MQEMVEGRTACALERLLQIVWFGSMWTVGYLVAPVLFSVIPDRVLAGLVAGHLFRAVAWIGLLGGGVLTLIECLRWRAGGGRWRALLLLSMLVLVAVGEFWLQPAMEALKAAGVSSGGEFARLHGIAASIYLLQSLLALGVVLGARRS